MAGLWRRLSRTADGSGWHRAAGRATQGSSDGYDDGEARVGRRPEQAYLHVIAHADDGIYFMNPDLEQSIRSGALSVTVCMTSGESDGRNAAPQDPAVQDAAHGPAGFRASADQRAARRPRADGDG